MLMSVTVDTGSELIGKAIKSTEKAFSVKIKQLENFDDRICPFPWERLPHNRKIKEGDTLTVSGEQEMVSFFRKVASLN